MSTATIENLGLTKQREVILHVIRESEGHLTASEVFGEAKQRLPSISFATVYNSLRYLREAGHIAEKQFGSGASRFDRITSRHDHAICTKCDKLVDIEMKLPGKLVAKAAKKSNFKPESLEFTLRGVCPECNRQKAACFRLHRSIILTASTAVGGAQGPQSSSFQPPEDLPILR